MNVAIKATTTTTTNISNFVNPRRLPVEIGIFICRHAMFPSELVKRGLSGNRLTGGRVRGILIAVNTAAKNTSLPMALLWHLGSTLFLFGMLATLHAAPLVDPTLMLWLPLDEGAGTLTADQSPNHLEAELPNVQWAKGVFGTAARFGGTNAAINLPPISTLNGATQFTLSVWATWEGTGRYPNLFTSHNWSPGGLMLFVNDDTCAFRMGRPDHRAGVPGHAWTETSVPLLNPLPRRQWTHLCVVFALPQITTYVNGKMVAQGTWNYPVQAESLRLGGWSGPVSHQGLIDDVRIYRRALASAEINALAHDPTRTDAAYTVADETKIPYAIAATFENRRATLRVDTQGRLVSLHSKASARELLAHPQPLVSARLKDGLQLTARKVTLSGNLLTFEFPRGLGIATLAVETLKEFFSLKVQALTLSNVQELSFFTVPATAAKYQGNMANLLSDDEDAVCLRGYELPVEMSASHGTLRVWTTADHGLTGWSAGLAVGPKSAMPVMSRAMAEAAGVPISKQGGPWSLGAEANRGSYLFADLAHAATDDWIELARRGGFSYIHLHGWWRTLGHYEVSPNLYPKGLEDFRDTVARIHTAGLKAGIHTLTGCIDTRDPWITSEANSNLIAAARYTLARPLSPTDTVLYVNEKPGSGHDVVFTYSGNGNAIRIGSEIIQYSEIIAEPPYAFAKCTRGAFKTRPAAHAVGEQADYLQQRYMAFYPQPDSPLASELADGIANIFNTCKLDQIYFDGSEGMMSRYGVDAMRHAIFKRLHGDVLAEASCHGAHNWWFHSRLGAWDHPVWAAKRFQDKHIAESSKYRATDLLEPQMGWWAPRGPSAQARGHFLDEMEYFATKNLGLDSAMSIQGVNVSRAPLPLHIENQFTLLGWYEHLRLARYFDTQTVARVVVPGEEFRLRQNREGSWQFTPIKMDAHRISALGNGSENWTSHNRFSKQPLAARVEALYAVASYDAPKRISVSDFTDLKAFTPATASAAISLKLAEETTDVKGGSRNLRLRAENKGITRIGAWARASLSFSAPYRNLAGAGAFGVWIKGDGKGALLNIQFSTPREYMHALSDHYVTLDFTGWRYVELLVRERDVEQMTRYTWPYGGSYDIYRNPLDMTHISQVSFYLNNLPPGETTETILSPVMALPVQSTELKTPALTVNGQSLTLPLTMKSGDFLELEPSGLCTHYSDKGDLLARVRPATADIRPMLRTGENTVTFACNKPQGVSARAEVTINTLGTPFGTPNPRRKIAWENLTREYEMTRIITTPDGPDNTWDIAVRPGEKAALEIELTGEMESPVLNVNGHALRFPVTLKTGQRLLCRDQRQWVVLDVTRTKIAEGRLAKAPPILKGGLHPISFTCVAPNCAQVKLVKVYK